MSPQAHVHESYHQKVSGQHMVGSEEIEGVGEVGDVQTRSVAGWRGVCARKEVLVQLAQHVSGGGSQQLTYLDVAGKNGLVLALLAGREEVMGREIDCDSRTYFLFVLAFVVDL